MTNDGRGRSLLVFGLALFILVPSFDTLGKYFGGIGILLYSLLGLAAVLVGYHFIWPVFQRSISERTGLILAAATLIFLIIEVAFGYPLANSGRIGPGSDVDDALIIGAGELLKGNYPYYLKTYLGLPLSPLPGAMLLAVPWVLFGALEYQNVFWLGILFVMLWYAMKSSVPAIALFWAILLLSPTVHQSLVTGSDYISNTIYVLAAAWFLIKYATDAEAPAWKKILPAVLLGIALSSRTNFLLVMPICFVTLARAAGWKEAIRSSAIAAASLVLVTLPFWAFDPAGFTPITTQAVRLRQLDEVLPYSGRLIPASAGLIGAALAFRKNAANLASFLLNNGIVQLYLIVTTSIVYAIHSNKLNLFMNNSGYGLFGLFFGALGCWLFLNRKDAVGREHGYGQ